MPVFINKSGLLILHVVIVNVVSYPEHFCRTQFAYFRIYININSINNILLNIVLNIIVF